MYKLDPKCLFNKFILIVNLHVMCYVWEYNDEEDPWHDIFFDSTDGTK